MATYYLKAGTSTFGSYNSFQTAKTNADIFNSSGGGSFYVSDDAGERIYPFSLKYIVKDPDNIVATYNSFADAFNAAKSHFGYIIADSENNQIYPTQAYYWTADLSNLYFYSNSFSAAKNNTDIFRTMAFNNSYKVYDNCGNLIYPNNTYFVSTGSGSATKYTDYEAAKLEVMADSTKKVFDPLGNVIYEAPANLSVSETEIRTCISELAEKINQIDEIVNNGIMEV